MRPTAKGKFLCALIATTVIGGAALQVNAQDKDPNLTAIKARQGYMQLNSINAGPLFGMAKGKVEYDAERAAMLANNLMLLSKLNNGAAWPEGSDNMAYDGKTRALPEIWHSDSKVGEAKQAWVDAVTALSEVAGNGVDALRSKIGDLGEGCKGCHDEYRAEDQ